MLSDTTATVNKTFGLRIHLISCKLIEKMSFINAKKS